MGDKRLNFNRPLLSVRRFSPAVGNAQKGSRRNNNNNNNGSATPGLHLSPSYRSDMHSGPLRNPGTVPFVWEQTPGKPKDETKTQKPLVNPPPGRVLEPKEQGLCDGKGPTKDGFGRSEDCKNERPQITYGPNFLELNEDGDNDDEDDGEFEYDGNGNMSLKFCGLLPQFCLKGSIGMLNQAPGLSVRTRLPVSSSAIRTRVGASSAGSQDAKVAAYQPKSSVKNPKDPTFLNHEQGHCISTNHNDPSPPPYIPEEVEINTQKKGLVSFQELLAYEIQKEKNFQNHTIEKTLYVDKIHKVESLKLEFKETDDLFGISHIPTKSFKSDSVADNSNHDKEMITQTGVCNRSKVDQKVKFCQTVPDLPAPPPLPKSPSDSWLWRTLPSMNSKTASLRSKDSKHKLSSKTATKEGKNVQSQYPEGLLLPISET